MPPFISKMSPSKKFGKFWKFVRILQNPESELVNDLNAWQLGDNAIDNTPASPMTPTSPITPKSPKTPTSPRSRGRTG